MKNEPVLNNEIRENRKSKHTIREQWPIRLTDSTNYLKSSIERYFRYASMKQRTLARRIFVFDVTGRLRFPVHSVTRISKRPKSVNLPRFDVW